MTIRVAVGQAGSVLFDTAATLVRVEKLCRDAAADGAKLLVLPEAMLGGYPKGLGFGAVVGSRSDEGKEMFRRYSEGAVRVPGVEVEMVAGWAAELKLHVVIGVVEREGRTLYCSSLLFAAERGLVAKHRKLMPTGSERLLWGQGGGVAEQGAGMQVVETELGRVGMAICWENYMPMYRQHLYNQGVELWCAPTVDAREIWQVSMRHIAYEGRCFVLSACQSLSKANWQADLRDAGGEIEGRSLIVSPRGEVVAGSMVGEGLLFAELDMGEVQRGKFDLDVAGHYGRRDLFELTVR